MWGPFEIIEFISSFFMNIIFQIIETFYFIFLLYKF